MFRLPNRFGSEAACIKLPSGGTGDRMHQIAFTAFASLTGPAMNCQRPSGRLGYADSTVTVSKSYLKVGHIEDGNAPSKCSILFTYSLKFLSCR